MRQAHVGQITVAWTDCKTINLSQSYIERIPVEKHSKSVFSFTEHPLPPLLYLSERSRLSPHRQWPRETHSNVCPQLPGKPASHAETPHKGFSLARGQNGLNSVLLLFHTGSARLCQTTTSKVIPLGKAQQNTLTEFEARSVHLKLTQLCKPTWVQYKTDFFKKKEKIPAPQCS